MSGFVLPHDHGGQSHAEDLHRALMNISHFAAVSETFRQLSDPTRVRIFWLLSHEEITTVLIGASKTQQILDNIKAVQNMKFTTEELAEIDRISK